MGGANIRTRPRVYQYMAWLIRFVIAGVLAALLAVLHFYSPLRASSVIPYAGLILVVTGLICLIRPLKILFVHSRKTALGLIVAGLLSIGLALVWPAYTVTVYERTSLLDEAMPQYEFVEHHRMRVRASADGAYSALQAVTVDELAAYPMLMKVRSAAMGRSWSRPTGPSPAITAIFSDPRSGYMLLQRNEREMVFGGIGAVRPAGEKPSPSSLGAFATFDRRGWVKVAFNLKAEDAGNGWTTLSTETRLHALDPESRRATAAYWRLIYPGSGMLRTMWLQAARDRAKKTQ